MLPDKTTHFRPRGCILAFILLLILGCLALLVYTVKQGLDEAKPLFAHQRDERIDQTPAEVRALREIGQWEFLAVDTEELVERSRKGILGDSHLVRIYRGTLRLGIDMKKTTEQWFSADSLTAVLRLPDIHLLDENFIDETHTTSFHEEGSWTSADKNALYEEARAKMRTRALSPQNLLRARRNAEEQLRKIFLALGYKEVVVSFGEKAPSQPPPKRGGAQIP